MIVKGKDIFGRGFRGELVFFQWLAGGILTILIVCLKEEFRIFKGAYIFSNLMQWGKLFLDIL